MPFSAVLQLYCFVHLSKIRSRFEFTAKAMVAGDKEGKIKSDATSVAVNLSGHSGGMEVGQLPQRG